MISVLVAEDEQLIRRGLIRQVNWEACGCTVAGEAANGREALTLIEKLRPGIVITDVRMPLMDGLEMLRESKERYGYEAIILSGYGEFEYARQALALGVADYLLKPVDLRQLEALLISLSGRIAARAPERSVQSLSLRAEDYIEQNVGPELSASRVAEAMQVSVDHLSRLMKRDTGLTLHERITKARIDRACALLKDSPALKVYEVAEKIGYPDYKYFHAVFIRLMGVSPLEYKKKG